MANEEAHVRLALRNQATIDHLQSDVAKHSEWITTVAFYKALHIVEAMFFSQSGEHGHSHDDRANRLKREHRYSHIWKYYRPLWAASTVARYLQDTIEHKRSFNSFAEYFSAEDVKRLILNHYLRQVQKSASNFLSSRSVADLGLPPDNPEKSSG